ncbi:hypothetical protein BLNAU_24807 [Blattamonas nauphoetae]|uniref:RRM domain-containing protein n=1 Tax=Blattamonas nauphoetae TaxID=2049346 RepID=A0ABQ9WLD7_9EUKA|nr:hypothetical protein BLNAU_24807 [Blattamonas nauphoetae]
MMTQFDSQYGLFFPILPPSVNQPELIREYSKYGEIIECSVIRRDNIPEKDGYAFLRFQHYESAMQALDDTLPPVFYNPNTNSLFRLECHFADSKDTLFVSNVPTTLSESALSFRLALDGSERSRGHGWLTFRTHEESHSAMRRLSGHTILGNTLVCYFARRRVVDPRLIENSTSLFISGLPDMTTLKLQQSLRKVIPKSCLPCFHFVSVPSSQRTGRALGHALMHFSCHHSAQMTMATLVSQPFFGAHLNVEWSVNNELKARNEERFLNPRDQAAFNQQALNSSRRTFTPCEHAKPLPVNGEIPKFRDYQHYPPAANYQPNPSTAHLSADERQIVPVLIEDHTWSLLTTCPWKRLALDESVHQDNSTQNSTTPLNPPDLSRKLPIISPPAFSVQPTQPTQPGPMVIQSTPVVPLTQQGSLLPKPIILPQTRGTKTHSTPLLGLIHQAQQKVARPSNFSQMDANQLQFSNVQSMNGPTVNHSPPDLPPTVPTQPAVGGTKISSLSTLNPTSQPFYSSKPKEIKASANSQKEIVQPTGRAPSPPIRPQIPPQVTNNTHITPLPTINNIPMRISLPPASVLPPATLQAKQLNSREHQHHTHPVTLPLPQPQPSPSVVAREVVEAPKRIEKHLSQQQPVSPPKSPPISSGPFLTPAQFHRLAVRIQAAHLAVQQQEQRRLNPDSPFRSDQELEQIALNQIVKDNIPQETLELFVRENLAKHPNLIQLLDDPVLNQQDQPKTELSVQHFEQIAIDQLKAQNLTQPQYEQVAIKLVARQLAIQQQEAILKNKEEVLVSEQQLEHTAAQQLIAQNFTPDQIRLLVVQLLGNQLFQNHKQQQLARQEQLKKRPTIHLTVEEIFTHPELAHLSMEHKHFIIKNPEMFGLKLHHHRRGRSTTRDRQGSRSSRSGSGSSSSGSSYASSGSGSGSSYSGSSKSGSRSSSRSSSSDSMSSLESASFFNRRHAMNRYLTQDNPFHSPFFSSFHLPQQNKNQQKDESGQKMDQKQAESTAAMGQVVGKEGNQQTQTGMTKPTQVQPSFDLPLSPRHEITPASPPHVANNREEAGEAGIQPGSSFLHPEDENELDNAQFHHPFSSHPPISMNWDEPQLHSQIDPISHLDNLQSSFSFEPDTTNPNSDPTSSIPLTITPTIPASENQPSPRQSPVSTADDKIGPSETLIFEPPTEILLENQNLGFFDAGSNLADAAKFQQAIGVQYGQDEGDAEFERLKSQNAPQIEPENDPKILEVEDLPSDDIDMNPIQNVSPVLSARQETTQEKSRNVSILDTPVANYDVELVRLEYEERQLELEISNNDLKLENRRLRQELEKERRATKRIQQLFDGQSEELSVAVNELRRLIEKEEEIRSLRIRLEGHLKILEEKKDVHTQETQTDNFVEPQEKADMTPILKQTGMIDPLFIPAPKQTYKRAFDKNHLPTEVRPRLTSTEGRSQSASQKGNRSKDAVPITRKSDMQPPMIVKPKTDSLIPQNESKLSKSENTLSRTLKPSKPAIPPTSQHTIAGTSLLEDELRFDSDSLLRTRPVIPPLKLGKLSALSDSKPLQKYQYNSSLSRKKKN